MFSSGKCVTVPGSSLYRAGDQFQVMLFIKNDKKIFEIRKNFEPVKPAIV